MRRSWFLALGGAFLLSCGDSEPETPLSPEGPLYALGLRLFTPDVSGAGAVVRLVSSLTDESAVESEVVIEVAGGGNVYGIQGVQCFFVTRDVSGSIRRFEVESRDTPELTGEISFGSQGITGLFSESVAFGANEEAFVFDPATLQAVAWNTETMMVTATQDLAGSPRLFPS